jgi:hypothetical protein
MSAFRSCVRQHSLDLGHWFRRSPLTDQVRKSKCVELDQEGASFPICSTSEIQSKVHRHRTKFQGFRTPTEC